MPVLMLVRHAECANQPLRSQIAAELGDAIFRFPEEFARRRLHDPGLSERGHVQAKELAGALAHQFTDGEPERTLLITSPTQRALETALPVARRGQLPREQIWCHLELFEIGSSFLYREFRPSELALELEAEFGVRCCELPADADYPEREGGEDGAAALARVARTWAWLEGLLESDEYDFIAVIAHAKLLSRWLQHVCGMSNGGRIGFAHSYAGMSFVAWWEGQGAVLERLNNTDHLIEGYSFEQVLPREYLEPL